MIQIHISGEPGNEAMCNTHVMRASLIPRLLVLLVSLGMRLEPVAYIILLASFSGCSCLQILIACSMQKWRGGGRPEKESHA